ncbi:WD repeat-containing protein 55 homolog [Culicoides brevitarsis]|uniref:WD repeat-containing protein 55 homolog n=1 Tax=Culicoides brevitarsis TaxID=469753 RepID=UPI00307C5336
MMHDFYPPRDHLRDYEYDSAEEEIGFDADQIDVNLLEAVYTEEILPIHDDDDMEDDNMSTTDSENSEDFDDSSTEEEAEANVAQEGSSNNDAEGATHRVIDDYDENEEEDDVLRAIIQELKKARSKPPDIKTEDFVVDLSFHTEADILAVATVTGDILMYKYSNEENTLVNTFEVHTKACRNVEFTRDGSALISSSRDKSLMLTDAETGKLKRFWDEATNEPVYSLAVLDENLFATGDDEGTVKLWDMRQKDTNPIFSLKEVDDYISALISNDSKKYLLATSGDGTLTTLSIPGKKLYVQSEPYEEELTCLGIFRNDSKVITGTSKGNFYTFNWNQFGYHCDAFSGPASPISKMIPITERIAITAGEEGILRAMHMVPGRVLGVVGQHSLAVEAMDINATGEIIASSSHDNDIRFWNIKFFEDFDNIKYNEKPNTRKALRHNLPSSNFSNRADFFADLA